MDYNSEKEFLDEVEKYFKENGWKIWRGKDIILMGMKEDEHRR
jgi:hypothetical protein